MFLSWGIPILLSYLIGSISFSYLITRMLKGVDIRDYGSGNAGATNTARVLGKGPAAVVFLLDALKGIVSVGLGAWFGDGDHILMFICGIAAILGHNWPIYFQFRGGKGIATTVGVMAILAFYSALFAGIFAILFIIITRYVSLGSLIFTILIPFFMWIMNYSAIFIFMALFIALLAIWRHRQNIINLIQGNERKI